VGKLPDELETEPLKLVLLDELVEVHAEQLEGDTDVVTECEVFLNVDDISRPLAVLPLDLLQDTDLLLRLSDRRYKQTYSVIYLCINNNNNNNNNLTFLNN